MNPAPLRTLVDTGPIVAILDEADRHHAACLEYAQLMPDTIYTCWPVITEACYLLRRRLDLFERLLEAVHDGVYELLPLTELDVPEIGGTMTKYQDQGIDLADACLVRLANREGTLTVITVDERHFQLFRTAAGDPFQLLPRVSGA